MKSHTGLARGHPPVIDAKSAGAVDDASYRQDEPTELHSAPSAINHHPPRAHTPDDLCGQEAVHRGSGSTATRRRLGGAVLLLALSAVSVFLGLGVVLPVVLGRGGVVAELLLVVCMAIAPAPAKRGMDLLLDQSTPADPPAPR